MHLTEDSSAPILFEQRGPVAWLTLNRPATCNALSGEEMFAAFETLFERLSADLGVRVAVLTGAGSAFCSGGNVAEMRDRTGMFAGTPDEIARRYRAGIQRIPRAFQWLQVPIIALAQRIAANPLKVLRWTKQLLQQARTGTLDEALDQAGRLQGLAHHTADHAEAVASFFEKRTPHFKGQ